MTELDKLFFALSYFAGLSREDFELSANFWHFQEYKKGEFYNERNIICKQLGSCSLPAKKT